MAIILNLIIILTFNGAPAYQLNKTPFAPSEERCMVWMNSIGMQPAVYTGVRRSESGGPHGTCNVAPAAGTRCEDATGHTDDSRELNGKPSGCSAKL